MKENVSGCFSEHSVLSHKVKNKENHFIHAQRIRPIANLILI